MIRPWPFAEPEPDRAWHNDARKLWPLDGSNKLLVVNLALLKDYVSVGFDHEKMLEFVLSVGP